MVNGIHDGVSYQLVSDSQTVTLIETSEVRTSSYGRHFMVHIYSSTFIKVLSGA